MGLLTFFERSAAVYPLLRLLSSDSMSCSCLLTLSSSILTLSSLIFSSSGSWHLLRIFAAAAAWPPTVDVVCYCSKLSSSRGAGAGAGVAKSSLLAAQSLQVCRYAGMDRLPKSNVFTALTPWTLVLTRCKTMSSSTARRSRQQREGLHRTMW